MAEQNIAAQPPIDHWSHSSMGMLLRNPLAFKKKYILKLYENTMSPSGVVGTACHKAVEFYLNVNSGTVADAIAAGMEVIEKTSDLAIDYGKTGSREKMLKDYTQAIGFYFAEMPDWEKREVLLVEKAITTPIHDLEGNELSLPAKCYPDVVWRSTRKETFEGRTYPKGSIFIEDNKFSVSYTDPTDTDPERLRQAFFNMLTVKEHLGEAPAAMLFRETKKSKNKDGTPQSQNYVIDFNEVAGELYVFFQLYADCTKYVMNPDAMYLPNPADMFDGKDAWLAYRQNLITAEAPVIVHKTEQAQFQEKRYIPSAPDKVENRHLTDEERIRTKLQEFGLPVEMQQTHKGSSVIMYTLKPSRGVKMSTIEAHAKDVAIALKAKTIRVQAPIMGTDLVGIEVPNPHRDAIPFLVGGVPDTELLVPSSLNIPIGVDVYGNAVISDLRTMPHLLVAGSTGSGKSVFLNVALHALTNQNSPDEMQLMLFDPKKVELAMFADVPHLISDVITEADEAQAALEWLNTEMDRRYTVLQKAKMREIDAFNEVASPKKRLPYIVVVIDEFADLVLANRMSHRTEKLKSSIEMAAKRTTATVRARQAAKMGISLTPNTDGVTAPSSAEEQLVRLAQKARAVGIHLIIATQHPVVDVVTGLIKANMPTRMAFRTTSAVASKVVLDQTGAEELTGRGDGLFLDPQEGVLRRVQSFYA